MVFWYIANFFLTCYSPGRWWWSFLIQGRRKKQNIIIMILAESLLTLDYLVSDTEMHYADDDTNDESVVILMIVSWWWSQVKSQGGCLRACTIENEFICRSVLYRPTYKPGQPNCALYHLDHKTFPDGIDTFTTPSPLPLFDSGETSAVYLESTCSSEYHQDYRIPSDGDDDLWDSSHFLFLHVISCWFH